MKPFVLWKGTLKELFPDRDFQPNVYRVVVNPERRRIIIELRSIDAMGNDSWMVPDSIVVGGVCITYQDLQEAICVTVALEFHKDNDALLARLAAGNKQ